MNKLDELYLAVIQKDNIGNIIDIIDKRDNCTRKEGDYIVMSLTESVQYKKEHPQKNFCVSEYTDLEVVNFLQKITAFNCAQVFLRSSQLLLNKQHYLLI